MEQTTGINLTLTSHEAWALLDVVAGYREDCDGLVEDGDPVTAEHAIAAKLEAILSARHAALAD